MIKKKQSSISRLVAAVMVLVCVTAIMFAVTDEAYAAGNPYNYYAKDANGNWANCTWWAWQLAYENCGVELPCRGNACTWYDSAKAAGYTCDQTPLANSIAVWGVSYDNPNGHVAFVVSVSGTQIYVKQGGYRGTTNGYNEGLESANGVYGYIHLTSSEPPSETIPDGTYYLRSALNNDLVIGVADSSKNWNANIQLESYSKKTSQQFYIESYNGKYTIKNVNSLLAMDVADASSASGANVQQYYFWPDQTKGQQWAFEAAGDGYYYIRSALGTYLDVPNATAYNGQNIWVYAGNKTTAQKFKLELVAPTISMASEVYKTGDSITVEFGNWNGAKSFEYFLVEFPEAFAYTTYRKHEIINWKSITFGDLADGHYTIFVHAINDISKSGQSNWLSFDVYNKDYIPVAHEIHDGHIYAVYDDEMSWTFAKSLCENMGGHLVTINDENENNFIQSLIDFGSEDAYWIGACNYDSTKNNQDGEWKWVTGEKFGYTNWNAGEPSSSGSEGTREHWAEIRKSYAKKWNDTNNTNKTNKGFILEIEPCSTDITARATYNGSEYILIDKNTSWSGAIDYCKTLGGHLLEINDDEEETFIDTFIESGTRNWYYLGGVRKSGVWHWVEDGSEITDIDWNGNLWGEHCNYLMKYKSSKKYINFPNVYYPENDISHIGFICEVPKPQKVIEIQATNHNGTYEISTTGEVPSSKIILTLYDESGRMVECHMEDYNGTALAIPVEKSCFSAKAMLLSNDWKPLCEVVAVDNN